MDANAKTNILLAVDLAPGEPTRLRAAGVTASGLIRAADEGHVTQAILDAARTGARPDDEIQVAPFRRLTLTGV